MRDIVFRGSAFDDFNAWSKADKHTFKRLVKLIEETRRNPYDGIGKPEPLKHQLAGCWSRRINVQHRMIYIVTDVAIEIISCKFHYK
ncbi:MAG: Txe/YoeB family addiction module toxin [Bacteroidales bacterium]|jgi:toxin YoeB|nr:Txe/YoeB family addiction module toxin [Bacteroidales bacterium]